MNKSNTTSARISFTLPRLLDDTGKPNMFTVHVGDLLSVFVDALRADEVLDATGPSDAPLLDTECAEAQAAE